MQDVKIVNDTFQYADGSHFPFLGLDGYSDFARLSNGEDIRPLLSESKELGATVRRVFLAVDSFAKIHPLDSSYRYDLIPVLVDLYKEYNLTPELTHGDLQIVCPTEDNQYSHWMKLFGALGDRNVFTEINEFKKNGGNGNASWRAYQQKPSKVLMALGSSLSNDECPTFEDKQFDWAGIHLRRDIGPSMYGDAGSSVQYSQQGYTRNDNSRFRGVGNIPCPFNEIIKAGSQCQDPNVYRRISVITSAFNGSTFHSDRGILSQLLKDDSVQMACAEAFFDIPQTHFITPPLPSGLTGYDENQVVEFQKDVKQAYLDVGRQVDLENVVWSARMVFDSITMGYYASRIKHLAELKSTL